MRAHNDFREGVAMGDRHAKIHFWLVYFIYFSGYALFSSYLISYLDSRQLSATVSGAVASAALLASVLMQPISGYITDTFIPVKKYLQLSAVVIILLNLLNNKAGQNNGICIVLIILTGGVCYPFSQLLDAWVTTARKQKGLPLVYSDIRAGGSAGFAISAVLAGTYFTRYGYTRYFLLQVWVFALCLLLLFLPPEVRMGNQGDSRKKNRISFAEAFRILRHNQSYWLAIILFTLYWMSHRPVGTYLALICRERGGTDTLYGLVCAVGAAAEFLMLMFSKKLLKHTFFYRFGLLTFLLNLLRPFLFLSVHALWGVFAGQILQSLSFAMFYTFSVECFSRNTPEKIRNFAMSLGLMLTSAVGTLSANVLGGRLFDLFGSTGNLILSLSLALCIVFYYLRLGTRIIRTG